MTEPSLTPTSNLADDVARILQACSVDPAHYTTGARTVRSPILGQTIARVSDATPEQAQAAIAQAHAAFLAWREVPAPRRGELVRLLSDELR
ncbi:MAG: aldehyde dehydrogenase family protein, partial [Rhodoferax sp.]|nr:aldehyde dehydrogenase family protein [Rhodoferax sp.]